MVPILISRLAAADVHDAWDNLNVNDEDSEYALDNPDAIEAIREAWLALDRALTGSKRSGFLIEVSEAAAEALCHEADNRLDIARDQYQALSARFEADQKRDARALVRAHERLLKVLKISMKTSASR